MALAAGFGATGGPDRAQPNLVCRSEGVTRGGLASSRSLLLQPTGPFRRALARSLMAQSWQQVGLAGWEEGLYQRAGSGRKQQIRRPL